MSCHTECKTTHPPIWQYADELPLGGGNSLAAVAFVFVLVVTLPVYGLTLLLITAVETLKGVPLTFVQSLTDPWFYAPLLGTALLAAGMLRWAASAPRVLAFTFDGAQQLFTFTQTRPLRKPVEVQVPFSDILSVRPYLMASYDTSGHFQVAFTGPGGKVVEHRLGMRFPLAEMEFHAQWLRGFIGERAHEVLNLDL